MRLTTETLFKMLRLKLQSHGAALCVQLDNGHRAWDRDTDYVVRRWGMVWFRAVVAPMVGIAVCVVFGAMSLRPDAAANSRSSGADVQFAPQKLTTFQAPAHARTLRTVAPSLERIQPWISAVGAAVGVGDFNADGRDNEACLVDPRDDSVHVLAIPHGRSTQATVELRPPQARLFVAPMGCVPADINEDGATDAIVYYWGRSPVLFLNLGRGQSFHATDVLDPSEIWNSTALDVADMDGDGHLDIIIGNYFPDGARILDPNAADDSRIQMQDSMSLAHNGGVNRILLSRPRPSGGAPIFVDASVAFPDDSARAWTLAFGVQDLTGDLLPELYVANDFGPDQLLVNHSSPGHLRFVSVTGTRDAMTAKSSVLGRDSFKGMGVAFTHLGSDPRPSIMVSNITTPFALQESNFFFEPEGSFDLLQHGRSPYSQESEARGLSRGGWSWDIKTVDANNDGVEELAQATGFIAGGTSRWPELQELAMSNDQMLKHPEAWMRLRSGDDISGHEPNRLWCLQRGGRYLDCGRTSHFDTTTVSRGLAVADVNNDGLADVLVANQWAESTLMLNTTRTANSALWLRLLQPTRNGRLRTAIGAKVVLREASRRQFRQVYPANGHAGVSTADVHFGLGSSVCPCRVAVTWRTSSGQVRNVAVSISPGRTNLILADDGRVIVK